MLNAQDRSAAPLVPELLARGDKQDAGRECQLDLSNWFARAVPREPGAKVFDMENRAWPERAQV